MTLLLRVERYVRRKIQFAVALVYTWCRFVCRPKKFGSKCRAVGGSLRERPLASCTKYRPSSIRRQHPIVTLRFGFTLGILR